MQAALYLAAPGGGGWLLSATYEGGVETEQTAHQWQAKVASQAAAVSGLLVLWYSRRASDSLHQQWLCVIVRM